MKFAKYLEEERTSGKVKRAILGSIKNPKKDVINLKCEMCKSSDIHITFSQPVRQVLME